ncbi:MAG: cell division protein FtsA [Gammaproteobacteria bacterium WSBS_2016_MAG_OTU1]
MKQSGEKNAGALLVAVDFGCASVRVLVAEALANKSLRLQGIGEAESNGISEGRVVNIEKTVAALSNAIKEAEIMSRRKITTAMAAVTGGHITGYNAGGSTVISDPSGVSVSDIKKVKQMACAEVANQSGMRVIATLERDYELDGHKGVQKPLGMSGNKLSGEMHLVLASINALSDWEKCLLQCGVETQDQFIFAGLAAAEAVLTEDEKKLGVCICDIGASTTDIAVFYRNVVIDTFSLPLASDDIHRDIAEMHHASLESAEQAKKTIGLAGDQGEFVSLLDAGGGGENKQSLPVVRDTIAYRADEILETIASRLSNASAERRLSAGVVLVGDGALLPGLVDVASTKLNMPVRIGRPTYRGDNHERVTSPRFAVGMGLLEKSAATYYEHDMPTDGLWQAVKNWLSDFGGGRPDSER